MSWEPLAQGHLWETGTAGITFVPGDLYRLILTPDAPIPVEWLVGIDSTLRLVIQPLTTYYVSQVRTTDVEMQFTVGDTGLILSTFTRVLRNTGGVAPPNWRLEHFLRENGEPQPAPQPMPQPPGGLGEWVRTHPGTAIALAVGIILLVRIR